MINIRLATPDDYQSILELTRRAFFDVYRPGCVEHVIVDKLYHNPIYVPQLEYVIELDGNIIAHIIYARAKIRTNSGPLIDALIFGPISVAPQYQKMGYGGQLITYTLAKAQALGYPFVVITGHPAYYQRFGFVSCASYGINYNDMDPNSDQSFFMIKVLSEPLSIDIRGTFMEPSLYHVEEAELEAFEVKHRFR